MDTHSRLLPLVAAWFLAFLNSPVLAQDESNLLQAVAPGYPEQMYYAAKEGEFVVAITVLPSGTVHNARMMAPAPFHSVDSLLERCAEKWRFGEQDETTLKMIHFVFRLLPEGTPQEELGFTYLAPMTIEVRRARHPETTTDRPKR
jgi:TonB family protein